MNRTDFIGQRRTKPISELRKNFYKRLFYIGLCIIPIILFADNKGSFRFVLLPFFLIGIYQWIVIISLSRFIIDDFFPPKLQSEKVVKPFDNFMCYFSTTLFFVGLIFEIFEIENIDNTINGTKLFWIAGSAGVGLAIVLTVLLKLLRPGVYYESSGRFTVHFGLFVGLFLLAPALASFVNQHFGDPTTFCKKYVIEGKGKSSGRSTEYFLFLRIDSSNRERFSVNKTVYNNFEKGEEVELCMLKGRFGFNYVKEFK